MKFRIDMSAAALCASAFFATAAIGMAFLGRRADVGDAVAAPIPSPWAGAGRDFKEDWPSSWRVEVAGRRGWVETGRIPLAFDDAVLEVDRLMLEHGYAREDEVSDEDGERMLLQYNSRECGRRMWMLWAVDGRCTGFSWGISK